MPTPSPSITCVRGGVYFTGAGTLTITNSIVEGGYGTWFVVLGITRNSTVAVSDSTRRWRRGSTPGRDSGIGAIQILESLKIIALRNDISGTPDGIQVAGDGSRIERNWIHDVRDNTFGLLPTAFGHSYALEGATIAEWAGNKDTTNRPVGNPGGGPH